VRVHVTHRYDGARSILRGRFVLSIVYSLRSRKASAQALHGERKQV